jgi:hypothetical protein
MAKQAPQHSRQRIDADPGAPTPDIFTAMVAVEARAYARDRDLPGLIALWPLELADESPEGSLLILSKLRRLSAPSAAGPAQAIGATTSTVTLV